jgi:hypothetical protein
MICDLIKTGIPMIANNMNNNKLFTHIETILLLGSPVSNIWNYVCEAYGN